MENIGLLMADLKERYNVNKYKYNNVNVVDDFVPKNSKEQLAYDTALKFNDHKSLKYYLKIVNKFGEEKFKWAVNEVEEKPPGHVKKKGAYFASIIKSINKENK